jgi:hypothetical protein
VPLIDSDPKDDPGPLPDVPLAVDGLGDAEEPPPTTVAASFT